MDQPSNFIQTLFDFSFSEFVTTKIVKILYGIGILFATLGALAMIVRGFGDSFGKGLIFLLISPIVFIIYTIFARVVLETIIVLFRIAENVKDIADTKK